MASLARVGERKKSDVQAPSVGDGRHLPTAAECGASTEGLLWGNSCGSRIRQGEDGTGCGDAAQHVFA